MTWLPLTPKSLWKDCLSNSPWRILNVELVLEVDMDELVSRLNELDARLYHIRERL